MPPEQLSWLDNSDNYESTITLDSYISTSNCSTDVQNVGVLILGAIMTYTESNSPGNDLGFPFKWWLDNDFVEQNFSFDLDEGVSELTALEKQLVILYPAKALIITTC